MSQEFHPIAGAAPLADTDAGAYERRWLLVDPDGIWLDGTREPRLAELDLSLRFGYLVMRAPGMLRLDIPLDVIEDEESVERTAQIGAARVRAVDEGDLAAAWFSDWLGHPCRLWKVHPEAPSFEWPSDADPAHAEVRAS